MIPNILIRSVPEDINPDQEDAWNTAGAWNPNWELVTYRDPIDPDLFPRTSPSWGRCSSGAQLAGLVRLEALWIHGGIWLDSDIDILRPLDPLATCTAFAAWEDHTIVPDAVIGAEPRHPAIDDCIHLALERLHGNGQHWTNNQGAWATGPGVTTTVFPGRGDVLLLAPDSFYPVHYQPRDTLTQRLADHDPAPWTFGVHRWAFSWR